MMPNFFIVGAARSGTTSLDRYLRQHPEIFMGRKETHFFAADYFPRNGPGDDGLNSGVIHDEAQYSRLFASVAGEKAIGETSVFYLCFPGTAERIAQAVPDARIIIILREPAERAYSAYMHLVREDRETLSFAEGLSREEERKRQGYEPMWWYTELSLYYSQVKRYLEVFGRERVKVLFYEDLSAHTQQVLREVFAFLGVKEDIDIDTSVRHNVAGVPRSRNLYRLLTNFIRKPNALQRWIKSLVPQHLRIAAANKAIGMLLQPAPLDLQVRARLKVHFSEDVARLEELLQRDLSCWRSRELGPVQKPYEDVARLD